jgi:hypothetical protein
MARLATGYGPDGDAEAWYPFGWDAPAGSMYSTASDLTVLASALMAAAAGEETPLGTHLRPEVARRLLQPHYWNGDGQSWFGSPWETAIDASYSILGKGGHIPGYSALLAFVPDLRLAVALTFNGGADMYGGVTESTVGSLVTALARWLPGVEANPGPYWTDITGAYRDADSGTEALVYRWQAQWLVVDFGVRLASMRLQYVGVGDTAALLRAAPRLGGATSANATTTQLAPTSRAKPRCRHLPAFLAEAARARSLAAARPGPPKRRESGLGNAESPRAPHAFSRGQHTSRDAHLTPPPEAQTPAAAPRVVAGDATLTFRVYVRPGDGSCLAAELQAWDGQYVYFTLNHATGRGTTITTPGLAPGTVWSRIA